jgi:hypothetical protein
MTGAQHCGYAASGITGYITLKVTAKPIGDALLIRLLLIYTY